MPGLNKFLKLKEISLKFFRIQGELEIKNVAFGQELVTEEFVFKLK